MRRTVVAVSLSLFDFYFFIYLFFFFLCGRKLPSLVSFMIGFLLVDLEIRFSSNEWDLMILIWDYKILGLIMVVCGCMGML